MVRFHGDDNREVRSCYEPGGGSGGSGSTRDSIEKILRENFVAENAKPGAAKLICLIVGHKSHAIISDEIVKKWGYFNARSGKDMDIFAVGFKSRGKVSDKLLVQTIEEFEAATQWKYSGVTELIVANAFYFPESHATSRLDFSSALVLPLEKLLAEKHIASASEIIEDLIRFSKNRPQIDPSWKYSDKKGLQAIREGFKDFIIGALPESLRNRARQATYFAVKDLNKET
jgi:hypothetical protein